MAVNKEQYIRIKKELDQKNVTLVAVSKTKPVEDILELYNLGHRDFGENYVQEMVDKYEALPRDIRWHFIGHLQTNKAKYIAPFVHLIHGVDSLKLLKEVHKQSAKLNRVTDVLLQVHIAQEDTKFGLDKTELDDILNTNSNQLDELKNVQIKGLMGMASFTDDQEQIRKEFRQLKNIFQQVQLQTTPDSYWDNFRTLSMGMSSDYRIAVEEGSTLVRIGSLLFGERVYNK